MRLLRALVFLALAMAGQGLRAEGACAPDRLDIRGPWGEARFTVEIADTEAARELGLMFRRELGAAQGMLFLYPRPGAYRFWMRNTFIPLDMLFVTPRGVVQYVHSMAQPLDETPIGGGPGVQAVLEIRGGLARAIGIGPGDQLRHPAFGPGAAWPCED